MGTSAYPEYPDELKAASWEKDKKSGFDAKSDVADKLKALQKKHDAVDWKLFAPGWATSAGNAADLRAEGAKRDKAYAGSVLPLKKEALALAGAARTAEKKADKALLTTLKLIGKAAEAYAGAIDTCAAALKDAQQKAASALPAEDEDEDSAPSALVDPKPLFKQLTLCRKDPERRMNFAFVDAKDKQPAMLALHPRMGARALFGKLQAASGAKTGAYGLAWVDGTSLMLQLEKPLSGLVKKVRAPVKACGFKIAKAVLWNEDGTVYEQDEVPDEAPGEAAAAPTAPAAAPGPAVPPAPPQPSVTYAAKLAALLPRVKKASDEGSPDALKYQKLMEFAAAKAQANDFLGAVAALRQVEKLLESAAPQVESGGVDEATAFKARLKAALPGIQAAIQAGGDNAAGIKLKFGQMGVLAKKPDYPGAQTVLDDIDELMLGRQAAAPAGGSQSTARAKAAPSQVVLQKARLLWDGLRKTVQSQFSAIEQAVIEAVRAHNADPEVEDEFDEAEIVAKLKQLFVSLDSMDQGLLDKLDEALNAEGPQRDARYAEAAVLVQKFRGFAASDATLAFIDDNGFASTDIRASVDKALAELGDQI